MKSKSPAKLGLFVVLLAAASCRSAADSPTAPRPTPTRPVPSPTPLPALEITSLEVLDAETPGEWDIVGIVGNRSESAHEQVRIQLNLFDSQGTGLGSSTTVGLIDPLPAGAQTPFWIRVRLPNRELATVQPSLTSRPADDVVTADLTVAIGQQFVTASGERALFGTVTNDQDAAVQVSGLALLAIAPDSRPRALAQMRIGPTLLAAGESTPFLAVSMANPGHVEWRPYSGGVIADVPISHEVESFAPPELHFTPQGAPYVIGELEMSGSTAQRVRLSFTIRGRDRLLTMGNLETYVPLQPGTRLGYAATDFPGAMLRGVTPDTENLSVELRLESIPDSSAMLPLAARVDVFHSVGSALFLRGSLTNENTLSVDFPAVFVEVRRLDGELWTAGWADLSGPLEAGDQQDFVLQLPLDEELDLATLELDLRAYGTRAEQ